MAINEEKKGHSIRRALGFTIEGDSAEEIANFTIEKYEFKHHMTLSPELREEGFNRIQEILSQRREELVRRRMQILAELFTLAETTLEVVVKKQKAVIGRPRNKKP